MQARPLVPGDPTTPAGPPRGTPAASAGTAWAVAGEARLAAAGREFERLLVEQMLAAMQSSLEEGLFAQGGVGGDYYTGLFNQELSREMTAGRGLGLAEDLLRQLRDGDGSKGAPDGEGALSRLRGAALTGGLPWQGLASLDRAFALRRLERGQEAVEPLAALDRRAEVGRAARAIRPDPERVAELRALAADVAREVGVETRLALALVETESGWDVKARSPKGAMGLTQLMPGTARDLGVGNPWDARENLRGGLRYLRDLLERFHDRRLALAAYNAGPGAVERAGGVPPYAETRSYVARIEQLMGRTP